MLPGNNFPPFIDDANQELLTPASSSEAPELQNLQQSLEEKQDPAGDPKVKEYFATIQDLHSRNEEQGFADLDYEELQQITSDVIEKLPEQLQPLAADLAENYADVAKVTAVYSKIEELRKEWGLIEAIKENLEEPGSVLTLKNYTLNNSSACIEFLRLLSHITELNIEKIGTGDIFSSIGYLKNLQIIRILNAEKLTSFRGVEALSHLQTIELTNGGESIDLAPLHSIDSLQTVTINGRDVDWRSGHDIEEPGLLEILLAGMPAGMLVGIPPTVLANLPANVLAAMPDGLLAALQPDIPNGLEEVPEDRLDDLQELLTTTTGGTTASAFRPTTRSAESVNSPFSPVELEQAIVADGNLEQLGTSYNDGNHSPDGGTLSLESLYFRRRTE